MEIVLLFLVSFKAKNKIAFCCRTLSLFLLFYFLLALSTLFTFITIYYCKAKLNRPLEKYIKLMGLGCLWFCLTECWLVWWKSSHCGGKIIYCGCATSTGPCLLRNEEVAQDHTHQSSQNWHLHCFKLNSIAFIRAEFPHLSGFIHRTLTSWNI